MSGTEELTKLLPDNPDVILVAGQALATWVHVFEMPVPTALESGVTRDFDYLGDKAAAEAHSNILEGRGLTVTLHFPDPDHLTPNTAVLMVRVPDGTSAETEIDYLGALCGYKLEDEVRLKARAIPIKFEGAVSPLRVMHPFDCLKSRFHNLDMLPNKRNAQGIAQAHLAVAVVREFLARALAHDQVRSIALPMAERVIELAVSAVGVRVFRDFGIDPLEAIDVGSFPDLFRERRWPQAKEYVERRRRSTAPKQQGTPA